VGGGAFGYCVLVCWEVFRFAESVSSSEAVEVPSSSSDRASSSQESTIGAVFEGFVGAGFGSLWEEIERLRRGEESESAVVFLDILALSTVF